MQDRKICEAMHFDDVASGVDPKIISKYGSSCVCAALRAPYVYAEEWLKNNCKNNTCLDYACGTGWYSIFPIINGAEKIVGVDISKESLRLARMKSYMNGASNKTDFLVGDCEELDFEDASFDIVFSYGNLSYLDLNKAYSECARILRPSGKLLVVDTLGYNPFINMSRWLKGRKGARSDFMRRHILKIDSIRQGLRYFERIEVLRFFDITTLLVAPFATNDSMILRFTKRVDAFLCKIPVVRCLAFKVVFVLSNPKKLT